MTTKKPDFSAARAKYERRQKKADQVQDSSAVVAGTAGATLGLSGLRGAYYTDYPHKKVAHEAKIAAMKPGVRRTLTRHAVSSKPGFPVYAVAAGATGAGLAAQHYKKVSQKQALKYTPITERKAVTKAARLRVRGVRGVEGPWSTTAPHQADLERKLVELRKHNPNVTLADVLTGTKGRLITKASKKRTLQRARKQAQQAQLRQPPSSAGMSKGKILVALGATTAVGTYAYKQHKKNTQPAQPVFKAFAPSADPDSIQRHKKIQGTLGTAAAATGLTAFGAKGGAKLLPKLTRGGAKGAKYARHLDQTANAVLFGGAGLGGVAGLHQGAVYRAEGKLPKAGPQQDPTMPPGAKDKITSPGIKPNAATMKAPVTGKKGTVGKSLVPLEKALAPLGKAFDPERSRRRRSKVAEGALGAGAAATAVSAARSTKTVAGHHRPNIGPMYAVPNRAKTVRAISGKKLVAAAGLAAGATAVHAHRNRGGTKYEGWYDKAKPVIRTRTPSGPAQHVRVLEHTKEGFVPAHLRNAKETDASKQEWEHRLRQSLKNSP